ncbi:MAG TPA: hypothetical protein VKR29_04295 [Candidatus Binataceae bacterium]|nr:hypothetical protein [Candidatus Binataceae bacterium]
MTLLGRHKSFQPDKDVLYREQYIVIPEPNDAPSVKIQKLRPAHIVLSALQMLRTVELDNDSVVDATEVHDVWANRMLSAKLAFGS